MIIHFSYLLLNTNLTDKSLINKQHGTFDMTEDQISNEIDFLDKLVLNHQKSGKCSPLTFSINFTTIKNNTHTNCFQKIWD